MPLGKPYRKWKKNRGLKRRRKGYKSSKAPKNDYYYAKVGTVFPSHNLFTFLRFTSPMIGWINPPTTPYEPFIGYPATGTGANPYSMGYVIGHNMMTLWNVPRPQNTTTPGFTAPYADATYFGAGLTASTFNAQKPAPELYTWTRLTWLANFFSKCRIYKTWTTVQILAGLHTAGVAAFGNNAPLEVTWLTAKYVPGVCSPELLHKLGSDDLKSTKGCCTKIFSANEYRNIRLKLKVDIRKYLGCKDLADIRESEMVIDPNIGASAGQRDYRNPDQRNVVFTYIRIHRTGTNAESFNILPVNYNMQVDMTAKAQLFQLKRNNPPTVTNVGGTEETGEGIGQEGGGSSSTT